MGQPAENRATVRHLLNIRIPYDYTSPKFKLINDGVTELSETFEAESEDVQYIAESTKTTNIKSYKTGFSLNMSYIDDDSLQLWMNRVTRILPMGANSKCDYIRFNMLEKMYGTTNQFVGVRRGATVEAVSIGGSATDSMTSEVKINGSGDGEIGYITVNSSNAINPFTWTPATTSEPVITSPESGATITENTVTIEGVGQVGATVTVFYDVGKSLPTTTVDANGKWKITAQVADFGGKSVKIAATQTLNGISSITSMPVAFTTLATLEAPVISVPANGATGVSLNATISGTGHAGANVTVKDGADTLLTATVNGLESWSGVVSTPLDANENYSITATQSIGSITSAPSTAVSFHTVTA